MGSLVAERVPRGRANNSATVVAAARQNIWEMRQLGVCLAQRLEQLAGNHSAPPDVSREVGNFT